MKETIKYLSPHDFTQWACEQVRDGYGFVPLVGSGISTKSGILMGVEFTDYLTWTVYRCVALPGIDQPGHRLNLRDDGWPPQPRPAEISEMKKWVWRLFDEACRRCGLEPSRAKDFEWCVKSVTMMNGNAGAVPLEAALRRPLVPEALRCSETVVDDKPIKTFFRTLQHEEYLKTFRGDPETSPTSIRYIEESAVRALHDWRSTLELLSRLRSHTNGHLCLEEVPNQAVIDSFNLHITRGRRPNLAHGMLCHLATRARMRVILTTNFDTLLEDAFAQAGESRSVFPVSLNGDLPPPDSVHAQNCIVKLHGGVAETRANHSLDDPPTDEGKRRFFHYIRGRYPEENEYRKGFLPSNLLICGYSGSDMRCVQMIKYVLDSDQHAQVFWVCHSHGDVEKLRTLFVNDGYEIASSLSVLHEQAASGKLKARLIVTVSPRTDLLLYEFYQRLALTLPRGGFNFPLSYNVPPERSFTPEADEEPLSDFAKDLIKSVLERRGKPEFTVADGSSGLTSPLRQAFNHLTRRHKLRGIWMELDFYGDQWSLAHGIFEQMALQLGRLQLDHARFVPEMRLQRDGARDSFDSQAKSWRIHISQLLRYWNVEPSDWLIVLNARNGPGGATSWGQQYWDEQTYEGVAALIEALCSVVRPHSADSSSADEEASAEEDLAQVAEAQKQGFNIIYAPYTDERHQRDLQKEQWVEMRTEKMPQSVIQEVKRSHVGAAPRYRVRPPNGIIVDGVILEAFKGRIHSVCVEGPGQTFEERVDDVVDVWLDADCRSRELHVMRQRRFLYGLTLFRNARHLASFTSEGVYPAPYGFTVTPIKAELGRGVINVGIDNDWIRAADVNVWLAKLNSFHQILLCAPGAHAWMYRDARLALQYVAERTSPWELERTNVSRPECLAFTSALATRARTHLRIGTWYLRAFNATGHAVALLEALYHFAECVTFAPFAEIRMAEPIRPEPEYLERQLAYQRRLTKHALFEMIKALRLGRGAIEFWMQPSAGDSWFGRSAVVRLKELLQPAFEMIWGKPPEGTDCWFWWEDWLKVLFREMASLPSLDAEGTIDVVEGDECSSRAAHAGAWAERGGAVGARISAQEMECFDLVRQLPNFLGNALTLREKDCVEARLVMDLLEACETDPQQINDKIRVCREALLEKVWDSHMILRNIQAICEAAFLHLHSANCLEAEHGFEFLGMSPAAFPWFSTRSSIHWVRVLALCKLALGLCVEVSPELAEEDFSLRIKAQTLQGLALGHLGRFFEARRCFNDAHALLSRLNGFVKHPDVAAIYLREAEVNIVEAHVLRRFAALLCPKFLRNLEEGGGASIEKLVEFVRSREGGDAGGPGEKALRQLASYFGMESEQLSDSSRLKELVRELRKQGGPAWRVETIEMLSAEESICFFLVLSATLFAPTLHPSREDEGVQDDAALEAAVRTAAQYYHMYLGHLRPRRKGDDEPEFWGKRRSSLLRQHFAKLDDAWLALETAEQALSGKSHSSYWWGMLHHLRLLVFSEHAIYEEELPAGWKQTPAPRTLAFRAKQDLVQRITSVYDGVRISSPLTSYGAFSAVHHACRAAFLFGTEEASEYERKEVVIFLKRLEKEFQEECKIGASRIPALGGLCKERMCKPTAENGCSDVSQTLLLYAKKVRRFLYATLEYFSDDQHDVGVVRRGQYESSPERNLVRGDRGNVLKQNVRDRSSTTSG